MNRIHLPSAPYILSGEWAGRVPVNQKEGLVGTEAEWPSNLSFQSIISFIFLLIQRNIVLLSAENKIQRRMIGKMDFSRMHKTIVLSLLFFVPAMMLAQEPGEYVSRPSKVSPKRKNQTSQAKKGKKSISNVSLIVNNICPDKNHPHAIDLGLPSGTKWSCCNVGATKPENNGDYYAWGETSVKSNYEYNTYLLGDDLGCLNIGYDISGSEYDAAHVKWGGNWVMPSIQQFDELTNKCTYRWCTYNSNTGIEITGPNGSKLFFPASGIKLGNLRYHLRSTGGCWTSTANRSVTTPCTFGFDDNSLGTNRLASIWDGQSIRPVIANTKKDSIMEVVSHKEELNTICPDNNHPHAIDLNLPSGTKWACCNIGADTPNNAGKYYAWGETSPKDSYSWINYIHCEGSENSCKSIGMNISGTTHDAATIEWGNLWEIPTNNQYEELFQNCAFNWLHHDNIIGVLLVGSNGNKLFFPAVGYRWKDSLLFMEQYGHYGSASKVSGFSSYAYELIFDSHGYSTQIPYYRFCGVPIRAIHNEKE